MPNTTLLSVFLGIVAAALLLQGIALFAISRRMRDLSARVESLSAKLAKQADSLVEQASSLLVVVKDTAEKVHAMQDHLAAITTVVHDRVVQVDAFVGDATNAARLQVAKLQDVIDTTSQRIDETITTLQTAIIQPIIEVQALVRGVRAGLDFFFGRRRPGQSHQDEEMFI